MGIIVNLLRGYSLPDDFDIRIDLKPAESVITVLIVNFSDFVQKTKGKIQFSIYIVASSSSPDLKHSHIGVCFGGPQASFQVRRTVPDGYSLSYGFISFRS